MRRTARTRDRREIRFTPTLSPRQGVAWDKLHLENIAEAGYGGAKGGGKTVLGCIWVTERGLQLIHQFDLKPSKNPIPYAFMGRMVHRDLVETTLETWKQIIPTDLWTIRGGDQEIWLLNTVKIDIGGLASGGSYGEAGATNRLQGAQYTTIFIDQAEELTLDEVGFLRATLNRPMLGLGGAVVPGKILWTANPPLGWMKREFREAPPAEHAYIRALPADNPWLPPEYIDTLKKAYAHRPELLAAYLYGADEGLEEANQVIKDTWIALALQRTIHYPADCRLITCDPARFGDDETVIYVLNHAEIVEEVISGQKSLAETATTLAILHAKYTSPVVIDICGMGVGLMEMLQQQKITVYGVNGAEKATNVERYGNRRAEMWDRVAQMFQRGDIGLKEMPEVLRSQLTTPRFDFKRNRLFVEPKEDIKARLKRSPDQADAYVQGLYMLDQIGATSATTDDFDLEQDRRRAESYAHMGVFG